MRKLWIGGKKKKAEAAQGDVRAAFVNSSPTIEGCGLQMDERVTPDGLDLHVAAFHFQNVGHETVLEYIAGIYRFLELLRCHEVVIDPFTLAFAWSARCRVHEE